MGEVAASRLEGTRGGRRRQRFVLSVTMLAALVPAATRASEGPLVRGDLPRRADLGFGTTEADGGLAVRRLDPAAPAAVAGLRDGDRIVAVGGTGANRPYVTADLLRRAVGGKPLALRVAREGRDLDVRFTPPSQPLERLAGVETVYDVLATPDGARLRTLLTRPAGASGPVPAIFVTQWVSCDTIEIPEEKNRDGAAQLLAALAQRSGMATIRVERTASGDSDGPACHELDYDTEVAHYRHAFEQLTRSPWVDPARVVVLGLSLGSTTAPLVAVGHRVAGVVVSGGGAETYFERMLTFDRLAFERGGTPPAEVHDKLLAHVRFLQHYLVDGEDPRAIAAADPRLAGVWKEMRGTDDGAHYWRPYAWHRQAAARNFLAAWAAIDAPVLVLHAQHDQFEAEAGHRLIAEAVNRLRPGTATFLSIANLGHDFAVYPSAEAAMRWENGVTTAELVIEPILQWLRARGLAKP